MFADVSLPKRRYQVFTYLVPPNLRGRIHVGSRVLVPLGRTTAEGLVFHLDQRIPRQLAGRGIPNSAVREIAGLIESSEDTSLDATMIRLASQVSDYYLAPPASGLRLIIPPALPGRISKRILLTDLGREAMDNQRLSPQQAALVTRLSKSPKGLTLETLRKTIKNLGPLLTRLRKKEFIIEQDRIRNISTPVSPKPDHLASVSFSPSKQIIQQEGNLTLDQEDLLPLVREEGRHCNKAIKHLEDLGAWTSEFLKKLSSKSYNEILVYESSDIRQRCLIEAVCQTVHANRTALILAPEIDQVSQVSLTLRGQIGDRVALFHGDLSQRDRYRLWHEIQKGQFDVVVGTRTALFVPLPSLGLVWVEQEEDPSYKEEQVPNYHAREVARMRAQLESGVLVLSSAQPSLETVHHFRDSAPNVLPGTTRPRSIPEVRIVNLQQTPYGTLLSAEMFNGIQRTLAANGSVVLFLNRKGFSRALLCKDCGGVPQCSSCGVSLTVHKKPPRLVCSYCGQTQTPPAICPSCRSIRLEPAGFGTERLEEIVQQEFPAGKIARFDREMIKTSREETAVLEEFKTGAINILIGTELLFHAQMIPCADFVGVPYADAGLHIPDFRSAERTYRLLEQAVGLAAHGHVRREPAEVLLQTYLPSHHVIQSVAQREAQIFYKQELGFREALGYPPFTHLIQFAISGDHQDRVGIAAKRCRDLLVAAVGKHRAQNTESNTLNIEGENILGPIPSLRTRSRGKSRYVIVLKSRNFDLSRQIVLKVREDVEFALRRERMTIEINVDPIDIL